MLNASDEVAVAAFLESRIQFTDINRINATVLDRRPGLCASLDDLMTADRIAREMARDEIASLTE